MNKRRDKRGRILHSGECQLPDGRYRYKYTDSFGERKYVYSLRLDHNDPDRIQDSHQHTEKGSLRQQEN